MVRGQGNQEARPIILDLAINAVLGALFAWFAGDRLRSEGVLTRPAIWLVLVFFCTVRLPMSGYLVLVHPAWAWHYLADPGAMSALMPAAMIAAQLGAFALMWFASAWLMQLEKARVVLGMLIVSVVATGAAVLFLAGRLTHYSSFGDYGDPLTTMGIMEVKLGYALIAGFVGTVAAATFVCVELRRDARRARVIT